MPRDLITPMASTPSEGNRIKKLLTDRQLHACAMAWADRLGHAEIAAIHGITLQAVRQRIYRARQRMIAAGITPPGGRRSLSRRAPRSLDLRDNV